MESRIKTNTVIAGTAHLTKRRNHDPVNVVELMCDAVQTAAEDTGNDKILSAVDQIIISKGTWDISNPGKLIAKHFGLNAKSVIYDLGILQSSLVKKAIQDVSESKSKCTLIIGAETKDFEKNASTRLHPLPTESDDDKKDVEIVKPLEIPISQYEIEMRLIRASDQYALLENAYAYAHKIDTQKHQELINTEWEEMAKVADTNPSAWVEKAHQHVLANGWGRPIATPYKLNHVTQWNVNQASAIIITTVDELQTYVQHSDNCTFPNVLIESNTVTPVLERRSLHQCIGLEEIHREFLHLTKKHPAEIQFHELYSCFPIAVRLQREAYGLNDLPVTVTGGMTFGGGPFNNFTFQGLSQLSQKVREADTDGLITSISGMLTKQGLILITAQNSNSNILLSDVSNKTQSRAQSVEIQPDMTGHAEIISSTVSHTAGSPKVFVLVENQYKKRRLLSSTKEIIIAEFLNGHKIGHKVSISENGEFSI